FLQDLDTVRSAVLVPESFTVGDLDVSLDITHTFLADLDISLIAPDGTRVGLFTDVGGGRAHGHVGLGGEATAARGCALCPRSGVFQPEGALAACDGADARGLWVLEITDDAAADIGTLDGWTLTFETAAPDFVPRPDLAGGARIPGDSRANSALPFSVSPGVVQWGDTVTVGYTIRNQGQLDAGPFTTHLLLSAVPGIDPGDRALAAFDLPGLAAGTSVSGTVNVVLPGSPGAPPE